MMNKEQENALKNQIIEESDIAVIKYKVKEYAKAALPGLLNCLDISLTETNHERRIANKAFAIGIAMAEAEQEIFIQVDKRFKK